MEIIYKVVTMKCFCNKVHRNSACSIALTIGFACKTSWYSKTCDAHLLFLLNNVASKTSRSFEIIFFRLQHLIWLYFLKARFYGQSRKLGQRPPIVEEKKCNNKTLPTQTPCTLPT